MSNSLITSAIVAKEILPILENQLHFAKNCNRNYESEFGSNMARGYEPGSTIQIKRPSRYTYRAGRVASPQSSVDTTVPLVLQQGGCDLNFTAFERTLSISNEHIQNKLTAAMATVANEIDRQGLQMAHYATYNTINPTGALPTTLPEAVALITGAGRRLNEMAAPYENRSLIVGPALNEGILIGYSGSFNKIASINKQFDTGVMDNSFGLAANLDQNVDIHTNGAATATNIAGAGQVGANITVVATAGGTLTKGTVITLPGVFAVNPQTRNSTGVLANFVVTTDVPVGSTVIPVSPALVTSGPYQNVTASPTTGQPYVILGAANTSYHTNVAFHRDAFTLAMVPMWKPAENGVLSVAQETHKGFTIKVTDFYDGVNDNAIMRLDVLFGYAPTYPELSTKIYTI